MEVYAGFLEHTDVQVGKLIDELEARGIRDNTLVIYILSDNGASAEGMNGSVAELNAQNGIPTTVDEHIAVAEQLGGLDAIGGPKMDNMYHSAWAWAGDSPVPLHQADRRRLGRHPHPDGDLVAEAHQARQDPRPQFLHVNDVVPTIYEILEIQPPKVVDGHEQDPIDGTSFVYTFDSPTRRSRRRPSTSTSWAAAASTTRAGWPAPSGPESRGWRRCRTSPTGIPCRTMGVVRHPQGLLLDA